MDISTIELIVLGGTVLGAFGRTCLPYLQRLKEQEEREGDPQRPPLFQRKYWFTMAYSLAGSLAVGMTLFPTIIPTVNPSSSATAIVILSAGFGWGANDMVNSFIKMSTKEGVKDKKASSTSIVTKTLSDK